MSLTYTLRRWLDPSFASESERAKAELVFEHAEEQLPGDLGDVKLFRIPVAARALRCRICGREGSGDTFCLDCLADTMD